MSMSFDGNIQSRHDLPTREKAVHQTRPKPRSVLHHNHISNPKTCLSSADLRSQEPPDQWAILLPRVVGNSSLQHSQMCTWKKTLCTGKNGTCQSDMKREPDVKCPEGNCDDSQATGWTVLRVGTCAACKYVTPPDSSDSDA